MDIILIVLNIISIILLATLLFFTVKGRKGADDKDTGEEIRRAVSASVNEMGTMLISGISTANKSFGESVEKEIGKLNEKMARLTDSQVKSHIDVLNSLNASFKEIMQTNVQSNEAVSKSIKEKLEDFSKTLSTLIEKINNDVKENLASIRKENNDRLEAIQKAVDEKLEKTLNARLQQSFESVIKQIGEVNSAVGEIKGLAKDVSSLNKVLTNVKTKGIVGEIVLGTLMRELLAREQYDENVITKNGATERVEFAVKMPGGESTVYLPIDSKFPLESYTRLKEAVDECDKEKIEANRKLLRQSIKRFAKDIHDKYIDPPYTTDFAIMFLPIEGLYLEAIDMGLFEELQRDYKITVTGPSTLTAFLNALQMGFKTLTIQKRSAEVFVLLSAVKTEFEKFAGILDKAHKKVEDASRELSVLAGTRTKAIQRRLRDISILPGDEAEAILSIDTKEE